MTADRVPPRAVAARYYTDPAIFAAEKERLFARTWQFAGHASQLERPGNCFTVEIADESLVCVRGRDGVIRSFYSVCQHRAHRLVSGAGNARVIVCPYHAWTYELTGRLRAAPNAAAVPAFDRDAICLTEVRTEVFLGFVFVNLDPEARPMDEWFPGIRAEIEAFVPHWQRLRPLEWVEAPERCNWKVSVENYSECYHCALNHPTFSTGVIRPESYDIQPRGRCLRHTTEASDKARGGSDTLPNSDRYSSWFLWPMFSFQVYPGNLLDTYHWRPVDTGIVVVWRGWYSVDGKEDPTVRKMARQDRDTTVAEDIRLVESVQRGLHSRGYVPGPLAVDPNAGVNSEHSIMHLHRWIREALDDG